jgi:hypothetical protein
MAASKQLVILVLVQQSTNLLVIPLQNYMY